MSRTSKTFKKASVMVLLTVVMGLLAACGDPTATTAPAATTAAATTAAAATGGAATTVAGGGTAATFSAGKGCKKVGVLLPETDSSARWEAYDRPLLDSEIKAALPGATVLYSNANNNAATQQNQAEAALTQGACILVVGAKDSDAATAIVQKAKAAKVPVIAYDRLIQDNDLAYYVSFDNEVVGQLQGQYLVDLYKKGAYDLKKGANLAMINGSQTDNNAILFRKGALSKLQPLIDSKDINVVYNDYTPDWNNDKAQQIMDGILTTNKNNIQIAYVANDGMANTVIASLRAQKLNGKVPVTGQDATVAGIQNILTGDQAMTVYKAIPVEAKGAAKIVAAISNGTEVPGLAKVATKAGGNIPSLLATPVSVDKTNIKETVIADNYLKKEDICKGLPAGAGGIC